MLDPATPRIKALIVDDEIIACKNLRNIIEKNLHDRIEIVGMTTRTKEAEQMILELEPEVVFLDIELRSENAFQFLERIKPFSFNIIFVTAYDEYALRALKLSAIDYILKPISTDELESAIVKLEQKIAMEKLSIENTVPDYKTIGDQYLNKESAERIVLKNSTEVRIILLKDIHYVEARRSYSCFYFEEQGIATTLLMSKPISDYDDCLPQDLFYRIHKSYIVNVNFIEKIYKEEDQHIAELSDGTKLPLSRRKYTALQEFVQIHNKS